MDHAQAKLKLHEYMDGQLSALEVSQMDNHLKKCAECSGAYLEWTTAKKVFFKPAAVTPNPDFSNQIMARIYQKELEKTADFWSLIKWAVPSFGLVFGTLLFFSLVPIEESGVSTGALVLMQAGSPFQEMLGVSGTEMNGVGFEGNLQEDL